MASATGGEADAASAAPGMTWRALARVGLVMGAWTTAHLAVVASLLRGATPGGWWPWLAVEALLIAGVVALLASFRDHAHPSALWRLLVARPFWYAQVALLPMSLAGALGWLAGLPFGRAVAFGRGAVLVASALTLLLFVAGYFGSRALVVRRLTFTFDDLPAGFDGVTAAQLSDLHVGPHTSRSHLRRIVRAVEEAKPDIVVFTGDQVDDYHEDTPLFGRVFGGLRAPLGLYAVAGNHDVYAGWEGVRAGLEAAGIHALVNDAVPLRRGGDELWLVGTGDPAGASAWARAPEVAPDIERSLARVPPGAFTLALAHNPALWPALADRGVRLTLSGHTHHGQISIPPLRWCLASPFLEHAMGTHERGRSRLYINPGTNFWALPLRLGAWPEVTFVTLRRGGHAV